MMESKKRNLKKIKDTKFHKQGSKINIWEKYGIETRGKMTQEERRKAKMKIKKLV